MWFGNVAFLVMPPILRGRHLRRSDEAGLTRLRAAYSQENLEWDYVWLLNEAGTQFVDSGQPTWREGRRPFEAPSFFVGRPWPERPTDTYGTI